MNIKYFKLATFVYYIGIIPILTNLGINWDRVFRLQNFFDMKFISVFILPVILIWGIYFILKDK